MEAAIVGVYSSGSPRPPCCMPQPKPKKHSGPTHSMLQPSTRSGVATSETSEKTGSWGASEPNSVSPWALLASALPSFGGKDPRVRRRENTHFKGEESAQAWPSGLPLQQLGSRPKGGDNHWAERTSCLTHSSISSSSTSSPIPYQGDSCQHTLRKDMAGIHIKSSSPTKGSGHMHTA